MKWEYSDEVLASTSRLLSDGISLLLRDMVWVFIVAAKELIFIHHLVENHKLLHLYHFRPLPIHC